MFLNYSLLLSYPSGLNQTRSKSLFTLEKSKTKKGLNKRSSRNKSTQLSKCCSVAFTSLHLVQVGKVLAPLKNVRDFKRLTDSRVKIV
ncbi:hypothetical protein TNCT_648731 [Trichonephila clavata]|uniref:Uncharacterized protein n=1 Tax=Trichonephila clavata TaxID=2740835 RepID=A0A8X6F8S5_TRICU|nr:hypothetical protein TNCT_648731 [Trichonephila clavata]